jgi:hypothetical protein
MITHFRCFHPSALEDSITGHGGDVERYPDGDIVIIDDTVNDLGDLGWDVP